LEGKKYPQMRRKIAYKNSFSLLVLDLKFTAFNLYCIVVVHVERKKQ
jgi:hypothetical protein